MKKIYLPSASFGQSAFSPSFDPCSYVDTFGRLFIYLTLLASYRSVLVGSLSVAMCSGAKDPFLVVDEATLEVPSKAKRKRTGSDGASSTASSVAGDTSQSLSKN